jgi:redox-sensitive bicupin YhaK (pirin superfamily)
MNRGPSPGEKHIVRLHGSVHDDIGDLVTRRPLPGRELEQLDPFLFLNHHGPQVYPPRNRGLPFGPHPHRGFETVTFILQGELTHKDSGGHESVIHAGGVQWMTAGSGLVHAEISSEAFKARGGPLEILQLWVNLPSRLKMTQPRYAGVQADAIPAVATDDGKGTVHLISGEWHGARGPIESITGVFMTWVALRAGARVSFDGLAGRNVFLYVVSGNIAVGRDEATGHHLVELSAEGGAVTIEARADAVVLFGDADAIGEPVVAYGPFVMNTREEIHRAIADYQAGKFGPL